MMAFDLDWEATRQRRKIVFLRAFAGLGLIVVTLFTIIYLALPAARVSTADLKVNGHVYALAKNAENQSIITKEEIVESMGLKEGDYIAFAGVDSQLSTRLKEAWFVSPAYPVTVESRPFSLAVSFRDVFPLARDGASKDPKDVYLSTGVSMNAPPGDDSRSRKAKEKYEEKFDISKLSLPHFFGGGLRPVPEELISFALVDPDILLTDGSFDFVSVRKSKKDFFLYLDKIGNEDTNVRIRVNEKYLANLTWNKIKMTLPMLADEVGKGHEPKEDDKNSGKGPTPGVEYYRWNFGIADDFHRFGIWWDEKD